nr:MAG TPA: Repressor protein CI [Caudoviricetes sp.]
MKFNEKLTILRKERNMNMTEFANLLGTSKQVIARYEKGVNTPKITTVAHYAKVLGVSLQYLINDDCTDRSGVTLSDNQNSHDRDSIKFDNILPITKQRIPMLGEIACGEPIMCNEDRESYVLTGTNIKADFCLQCRGDSMTGARIFDGDIVFIHRQAIVENGQIAAVIIDDTATLKRVFYYPEKGKLVLQAENPLFPPLVYVGEELNDIRILGRAVAFQSDVK